MSDDPEPWPVDVPNVGHMHPFDSEEDESTSCEESEYSEDEEPVVTGYTLKKSTYVRKKYKNILQEDDDFFPE